jgi:hypothetical protein
MVEARSVDHGKDRRQPASPQSNPIEIHGTAATMTVPMNRATM